MQVEKIHDVQEANRANNLARHAGPLVIGVFDASLVRYVTFLAITAALFTCTVLCLLSVWQIVATDIAWRALSSFGIIVTTLTIFVCLNEGLGPVIRQGQRQGQVSGNR